MGTFLLPEHMYTLYVIYRVFILLFFLLSSLDSDGASAAWRGEAELQ